MLKEINCPDCHEQTPYPAPSCVHCGTPLTVKPGSVSLSEQPLTTGAGQTPQLEIYNLKQWYTASEGIAFKFRLINIPKQVTRIDAHYTGPLANDHSAEKFRKTADLSYFTDFDGVIPNHGGTMNLKIHFTFHSDHQDIQNYYASFHIDSIDAQANRDSMIRERTQGKTVKIKGKNSLIASEGLHSQANIDIEADNSIIDIEQRLKNGETIPCKKVKLTLTEEAVASEAIEQRTKLNNNKHGMLRVTLRKVIYFTPIPVFFLVIKFNVFVQNSPNHKMPVPVPVPSESVIVEPKTGMELISINPDCKTATTNETLPCIKQNYYLAKTEVTQAQWQAVMVGNPSKFSDCGSDCPVEQVSWKQANEFIELINRKNEQHNWLYRLPTEAEWQYACLYNNEPTNHTSPPAHQRTQAVGRFPSNALGLVAMPGNVSEWVSDCVPSPSDLTCSDNSAEYIYRGGSWKQAAAANCHKRNSSTKTRKKSHIGFRIAAEKKG